MALGFQSGNLHKTVSEALKCLGGLAGTRRYADAFGKGHKFRQSPNLHFLHHPVSMSFDGAFGTAYCAGGLLVGVTAYDKVKNLPLARRQC